MMLALGIRYLTGYAVATDVTDRGHAEWPPHPARVFMAMAAAHFETGEDPAERAALEWLERQGAPGLRVSEADSREVVTVFVPPNDYALPRDAGKLKPAGVRQAMTVVPAYRTNRQPRTFPCVHPREDEVHLFWPEADPDAQDRAALARLAEKVTRIGHSSSLVQMWVVADPEGGPNLAPDPDGACRLRIVGEGTLEYLRAKYNGDALEAFLDLRSRISESKGKAKATLRKEMTETFDDREPVSLRPVVAHWQGYASSRPDALAEAPVQGAFDPDLMVLSLVEGRAVGLEASWGLLTAMRDTILSMCDPTPEWVSGHRLDGTPSPDAHLALVPLAFVGHPHADGHLLGVGLAFPRVIDARERGRALKNVLYDDLARPRGIRLTLGSLGAWTLVRETRGSPPIALRPHAWTGPARTWASVTPIVLDRHPKASFSKEREAWAVEAAGVIAESCRRQGLPPLADVTVGATCWHEGAPRALPGRGGGYPLMPVKPGRHRRQQVHALLRFDNEVEGPLMLGAGRYRGYGVCRPWKGGGE